MTSSTTPPAAAARPPDPGSFREMFRDAGVRNYVFAGLVALAMVFVTLFQKGVDPIGGTLLLLVGGGGMVLRWPTAPAFVLLILMYFLVFPFGLPPPTENPFELKDGRFRIADLFLVGSVLVYFACHYRLFGVVVQAVPVEGRGPGPKPTRRPAALIRPGELTRLVYQTAGLVLVGQLVWLFVTATDLDDTGGIPLRRAWNRRWSPQDGEAMSLTLTRFVLTAGLLFFGTLLGRLVFGYWRLRAMSRAEGGMILQDAAWNETRREQARVARWRAWGWQRATARDQVARAGLQGGDRQEGGRRR